MNPSDANRLRDSLALTGEVSAHLSEDELGRYIDGLMEEREREGVEAHLKDCPLCAFYVADLKEQRTLEAKEAEAIAVPAVSKPSKAWRWGGLQGALGLAASVGIIAFFLGRAFPGGELRNENERLRNENHRLEQQNDKVATKAALHVAELMLKRRTQAGSGDGYTPTDELVTVRSFELVWKRTAPQQEVTVRVFEPGRRFTPFLETKTMSNRLAIKFPTLPVEKPAKQFDWQVETAVGETIASGHLFVVAPKDDGQPGKAEKSP